jgi:hypothetical protein
MNAWYLAVYLKDWPKALEILRQTNEFMVGYGPKATFTSRAHLMAGNEEAARSDLKAALRLVEDRLVNQPNDLRLVGYKAEILALQGDRAAAEPLVREVRQRSNAENGASLAYLLMLVNQPEAALTALESYYGAATGEYRTKAGLRYSPIWDPLRGNSRFEALLKEPEPKR